IFPVTLAVTVVLAINSTPVTSTITTAAQTHPRSRPKFCNAYTSLRTSRTDVGFVSQLRERAPGLRNIQNIGSGWGKTGRVSSGYRQTRVVENLSWLHSLRVI